MKKINVVAISLVDNTGVEKIKIGNSYRWEDEEPSCKFFHDFSGDGCINGCIGNEPYSCHRSKEEGLCHKDK